MTGSETSPTALKGGRYVQVDVTAWPVDSREPLGTKPKQWLGDPKGDRWLMKYTTDNQRHDGTRYRKGDDWSERIAIGVAMQLGVPAARTELAVENTRDVPAYGVISKEVLATPAAGELQSTEELIHGNQLVSIQKVGRERVGYSIWAVQQALDGVAVPDGIEDCHTAWEAFVGYLLLDAVVGNSDRHEENWAVIDRAGNRRLAATFDHASCLGFQLEDAERERRLCTRDGGYTPEAWADRAKSPFEGRPHPVSAALSALELTDRAVRDHWMNRCNDVDRLVEPVWMIPEARMSLPARQFAERVIRQNCRRLLGEFH
ncbi:MAG: hypothetical protein F4110_00560 [Acidimicrobiaceae bacterium]|nr:hypothetical protein [Acidimicrobiaceae bacterium]MXZ98656.1 hypothetical protein [Acidimicrobiaceae bacterium]MYE77160.1 hypothetical protein [Acidimicrobiaceae bacterium]MYE97331.1 hypothetical protein [Acidimicrobiaceae bacterium]MYI52480.1 hypothetical protein [Acidimicrobiaceae bacterium]